MDFFLVLVGQLDVDFSQILTQLVEHSDLNLIDVLWWTIVVVAGSAKETDDDYSIVVSFRYTVRIDFVKYLRIKLFTTPFPCLYLSLIYVHTTYLLSFKYTYTTRKRISSNFWFIFKYLCKFKFSWNVCYARSLCIFIQTNNRSQIMEDKVEDTSWNRVKSVW